MTNNSSVSALTLEGFQVFDEMTFIPLDRLTMIFGPNSAGKSAIQDALELYGHLLEVNDEIAAPYEAIKRHWRRSDKTQSGLADLMSIGVFHDIKSRRIDSGMLGGYESMQYLIGTIYIQSLEKKISNEDWEEANKCSGVFQSLFVLTKVEPIGNALFTYSLNYSLSNGEKTLFSWGKGGLSVSLDHPLLRPHRSNVNFAAVARAFPAEVCYENGLFTIKNGVLSLPLNGNGFNEKRENWLIPNGSWQKDSNWSDPILQSAFKEICLIVGSLLSGLHYTMGFKPIKVDASRRVPTKKDLSFKFTSSGAGLKYSISEGDPQYWPLAYSLCSELLDSGDPKKIKVRENVESAIGVKRIALSQGVSRAFTDHLFLEQGYRLDFDYRILLSKRNSEAAVAGEKLDSSEFDFLIEICLCDSMGRKHAVEDVGSGIGYILPILCNLYGDAMETTGFLQQPELHLHPALQAALGDVFIESLNSHKQVLIETHSEHLLLRLLKRVRQTHLQIGIAPELEIRAGDLCVLYFDPAPDGTTKVKRLRITEDGEFMDRWPRGFFGERDLELFDE